MPQVLEYTPRPLELAHVHPHVEHETTVHIHHVERGVEDRVHVRVALRHQVGRGTDPIWREPQR
eukprot:5897798-Pyramimonas_sp.AAC.1